jgi:hypothetical protein
MRNDGINPAMPPNDAPYLLEYFWEVGPALSGGMGDAPLTFQEIQSYQDQIGIELQPWEVRLLRRLSGEYLAESQKATKLNYPAPWKPEENTVDKAVKADSLRNALRDLAKL